MGRLANKGETGKANGKILVGNLGVDGNIK
jgi:hypothetical protein